MSVPTDMLTTLMTAEDLLALPPDDDVVRELFDGELVERKDVPHCYSHGRTHGAVGTRLNNWLDKQPQPRGAIVGGEAAVRIAKKPDTFVGVDVAYISAKLAAKTKRDARYIDGIPTLIVEILSPTDQHKHVTQKIKAYLKAGVPLVWMMDPDIELVTVFEPGKPPKAYNVDDTIKGDPHLPGFVATVRELFA